MALINYIASGLRNLGNVAARNAPNLLTGFSIVGVGCTTVLTAWGTIRAYQTVQEKEEAMVEEWLVMNKDEGEEPPKLTKKDVFLLSWRPLTPAALSFLLTIITIILARRASLAQTNAALALASVYSQACADLKYEIRETLGEKKAKELQDKIAQNYIDNVHPTTSLMVTDEEAMVLCYEKPFNHEFKSSYEDIRAAVNTINEMFQTDVWVSLNEFYYILGIEPIQLGYDLGWARDNGYLAVDFSAGVNKQHKPCLVIDFRLDERISGDSFSKNKILYS